METNEQILGYIIKKTNPFVEHYPELNIKVANLFLTAIPISKDENFIMVILEPISNLELAIKELLKSKPRNVPSFGIMTHELRKAVFSLSQVEDYSEKKKIINYFKTLKAKTSSLESYLCDALGVSSGNLSSSDLFLGTMFMDMAVMCNESFVLNGYVERKQFAEATFKFFQERGGSAEDDHGFGFTYTLGEKNGYITVTYCSDSIMVSTQ